MDRATKLLPDFITPAFHPESTFPMGAACLTDCTHTLGAVRYALDRYCEVGALYRGRGEEMSARFFERYYLDDVALRLYSAAEHLANAILAFFEQTNDALTDIKGTSQWERVRKLLNREHADHPITAAVALLRRSASWRFTMGYRGRWVHNQPDTVAGLGIVYERRNRWDIASDAGRRSIVAGIGDAPKHRIQSLSESFIQGFADFLEVYRTYIDAYYSVLADGGITEAEGGLRFTIAGPRISKV